jgi:hypothetical protein
MEVAMTPMSSGHTPTAWERTFYAQLAERYDGFHGPSSGDSPIAAERLSLVDSIEQALLEDERLHGD